MTTSAIRPATDADFEGLCSLFADLDRLHRDARPDLFQPPGGDPRVRADVADLIRGPNSAVFVACDEATGALLGLATLIVKRFPAQGVQRARSYVEIDNLVIHADTRRRGLGRALVSAASGWAQERWLAVELTVHAFNTDAVAFYEAVGFKAVGHRMRLCAAVA